MFIRDMDPEGTTDDGDRGLYLFMKGAPERILNRCTKILINGEERPYEDYEEDVKFANDSFGNMGERVLAFARVKLDPKVYTKNPAYKFDVKNWKKWQSVKEMDWTVPGWFPMFELTLIGIVSLNDPPRNKVDLSVLKC